MLVTCLPGRVYDETPSLPIGILLAPLIKQIRLTETLSYQLNIFDFEFLRQCAVHPRLKLSHAVQLVDLLMKIYTSNVIFARLCEQPAI